MSRARRGRGEKDAARVGPEVVLPSGKCGTVEDRRQVEERRHSSAKSEAGAASGCPAMIAWIAGSSRDVGGMATRGRSKVVKVPVFGENFGEEVRAGEMLLEEIFDSERVSVESREVLPGQGKPVVIEAGEMFVVGVIRKGKVVLVEMEQESSSDG